MSLESPAVGESPVSAAIAPAAAHHLPIVTRTAGITNPADPGIEL